MKFILNVKNISSTLDKRKKNKLYKKIRKTLIKYFNFYIYHLAKRDLWLERFSSLNYFLNSLLSNLDNATYDIIIEGFNQLQFELIEGGIKCSFFGNIENTFFSIKDLIYLIEYGNLNVQGLHIISKFLKALKPTIEKEITVYLRNLTT